MGIWPPWDICLFFSLSSGLPLLDDWTTPRAFICLTGEMSLLLGQASYNQVQWITVSCTPPLHSHYTLTFPGEEVPILEKRAYLLPCYGINRQFKQPLLVQFSGNNTLLKSDGKMGCFPAHTERETSKGRLERRHFRKVDTLRCSSFCLAFILGAHLGKGMPNVSTGPAFKVNTQSLISQSPLSGTVSKYFSSNKKIHIWSLRSSTRC